MEHSVMAHCTDCGMPATFGMAEFNNSVKGGTVVALQNAR
jgi:hypothetical protein